MHTLGGKVYFCEILKKKSFPVVKLWDWRNVYKIKQAVHNMRPLTNKRVVSFC